MLLQQLRKDRLAVEARHRVLRVHEDHDLLDRGGLLLLQPNVEQRPVDILGRQRKAERPGSVRSGDAGLGRHRRHHGRFATHRQRKRHLGFRAELRADDRHDLVGIDQLARQVDGIGVLAARVVNHELHLAGLAAEIGVFLQEHVDRVLLLLAV